MTTIKSTQKTDEAKARLAISNRPPPPVAAAKSKAAAFNIAGLRESPAQLAKMSADFKAQVAKDLATGPDGIVSPAGLANLKRDLPKLLDVYNKQAENALKTAKPGADTALWKDAIAENKANLAQLKTKDGSTAQHAAHLTFTLAKEKVSQDKVLLAKGKGGDAENHAKAVLLSDAAEVGKARAAVAADKATVVAKPGQIGAGLEGDSTLKIGAESSAGSRATRLTGALGGG